MFPLKKQFILANNSENAFLKTYEYSTEIPLLPHPGAFSRIRKNHIHEGVDLYCEDGDEVFSMLSGRIIKITPFTGEIAGSPWWNNTWSVLVQHEEFVLNYGEIKPADNLYVGKMVQEGEYLGQVLQVLKTDKGRPRSMLHLEMYESGTFEPVKSWNVGETKPKKLLDPTQLLIDYLSYD